VDPSFFFVNRVSERLIALSPPPLPFVQRRLDSCLSRCGRGLDARARFLVG
jgi:hypothetical protein